MQYVDPIEVRLQTVVDEAAMLSKEVENLERQYKDAIRKLNEARSRAGELALLRDIKEGRLIVVHKTTMAPAKIAIL